jgi:hypothetical protein
MSFLDWIASLTLAMTVENSYRETKPHTRHSGAAQRAEFGMTSLACAGSFPSSRDSGLDASHRPGMTKHNTARHREERSDEAIQCDTGSVSLTLACFADARNDVV